MPVIETTKKKLKDLLPGDRVLLQRPGENALYRTVAVIPAQDAAGQTFVRVKEYPELHLYLNPSRDYTVACPPAPVVEEDVVLTNS